MKFYTEIIKGDLILTKTNIPTPPPCPVIARRAAPAAPWLIRLVLCFIACFAPLVPHWTPPLWVANKARFAVLAIVALTLVEVLAQSHIEKSLGVLG